MSKEKVLVCIIAQARASKLTWYSFKENVLDHLNADLALCISDDQEIKKNNLYYENAKYIWECENYSEFTPAFDWAQKELVSNQDYPDWKILKNIKDYWLGGIEGTFSKTSPGKRGSAAILIFFRWFLLKCLKDNNILKNYDRFIVTRSDFIWKLKHPDLKYLDKKNYWIPYGEFYGGVTDRHVVLSKENLVNYLNIIEPIVANPNFLFKKMKYHLKWNMEKFILFSLKLKKQDHLIKFFPYIAYTVKDELTDATLAPGDYSELNNYNIKYIREYISSHLFLLIIKNPQNDWNNINLLLFKYKFYKFLIKFKVIRNYIFSKIKIKNNKFDSKLTENYLSKKRFL